MLAGSLAVCSQTCTQTCHVFHIQTTALHADASCTRPGLRMPIRHMRLVHA